MQIININRYTVSYKIETICIKIPKFNEWSVFDFFNTKISVLKIPFS